MKKFTVSEAKMLLQNGEELDQVFNFSSAYLEDFVQCFLGMCSVSEGGERLRVRGWYYTVGFVLEIYFPMETDEGVQIMFDSDVRVGVNEFTEQGFNADEWYDIGYVSARKKDRKPAGFGSDPYKDKEPVEVKVTKFKYTGAVMVTQGGYVNHQEFNFAGDNTLSDVLTSALSTCYAAKDRRKLEIGVTYGTADVIINVYFEKEIKVYAKANKDTYVPITVGTEQLLEAGKDTYICCVNHEGVYDTMGDVAEAVEVKEAVEAKEAVEDIRSYNVGASNYSEHAIQPWDIYLEYDLNPWDADIVKRVLRTKKTDTRKMDYEKIIHTCKERIRQIEKYGK